MNQSFAEIKQKYSNGKYWNHHSSSDDATYGVTQEPCSHHESGCSFYGTCGCNVFGNAIQCHGFAKLVAFLLTGTQLNLSSNGGYADGANLGNGWIYHNQNLTSRTLKPGDFVRVNHGMIQHSAIIWKVDPNGSVQVAECLGGNNCIIHWGEFNMGYQVTSTVSSILSIATYIVSAPPIKSDSVTVTFNPNGGTVSQTTKSYSPGQNYGSFPTVQRDNYTFAGWYPEAAWTTSPRFTEGTIVPGYAHTLYARWYCNVTFANGSDVIECLSNDTWKEGGTGILDNNIPNPPYQAGKAFQGWFTQNHVKAEVGTVISTATVFYPEWKSRTCYATFDPQGGTYTGPTQISGDLGTTYNIPVQVPVKENYYFSGWVNADDTQTIHIFGDQFTFTKNIHWVAKYIRKTHTVTLHPTRASQGYQQITFTKVNGETSYLPECDFKVTGFRLAGFSTSSSDTVGRYDYHSAFSDDTHSTLYAIWRPITQGEEMIIFDPQGGCNVPTRILFTPGEIVNIPDIQPQKPGAIFRGWDWNPDATEGIFQPGGNLPPQSTTHKLYAIWYNDIGPRVLFKAGDGTCAESSRCVNIGDTFGTLPVAKCDGYVFNGWYLSDSTRITPDSVITMSGATLSVYAQYLPIPKTYTDVPTDSYYYHPVCFMTARGYVNGTEENLFSPDAIMTRGQIATILYRMANSPLTGDNDSVDASNQAAVTMLLDTGISSLSSGSGEFFYSRQTTRQELATFLFRYAKHLGFPCTQRADVSAYTDWNDPNLGVDDWAQDAMKWCVATGIMAGTTPTTIEARGKCSRAMAVTAISRLIAHFYL